MDDNKLQAAVIQLSQQVESLHNRWYASLVLVALVFISTFIMLHYVTVVVALLVQAVLTVLAWTPWLFGMYGVRRKNTQVQIFIAQLEEYTNALAQMNRTDEPQKG